ncbi:hypothetical protein HaLaN_10575, partial [Haematococcus lacustris]
MSSVEEEVAGSEPSSLSLITADLALLVANHLALDEKAIGSFHPQTGTYVRPTWTHLPKLLPAAPDLSPAGQGPPELPGWTFLSGLDLAQTRALPCLVKDFRSLADLARHYLNKDEVVAFSTKGHVAELPAVQWSPTLEAWHGVYVRSSALAEGSLPPVPTWQQRFLHWASLRLPVVDQWVCSVAPGDYLLAWRVQFMRRPSFEITADLQLQGTRGPGEATSHLPLISRQNMSSRAGQHASHGQAVQGLPLYRHFSVRELQEVARSAKGSGWVWLQ